MEQQFLTVDPLKKEEQLYYPPRDFVSNTEIGSPQEDKFFADKTLINQKEGCCSERIIKNDINTFMHNNPIQKFMIYSLLVIGFIFGLTLMIFAKFELSSIFGSLFIIVVFLIQAICFDRFSYFTKILILDSNSIECIEKSLFRKKKIIYNRGELDMFAMYYKIQRKYNRYILYFVKKSGEKEQFCEIREDKGNELKGVKYFIDSINDHIQKNMK